MSAPVCAAGLAPAPAAEQAAAQTAEPEPGTAAVETSGGVEFDGDSGRRIDAALRLRLGERNTASLHAASAESTDRLAPYETRVFGGSYEREFGVVAARVGLRLVRSRDLEQSSIWSVAVSGGGANSSFGLNLDSRRIQFDPTAFSVTGADLGLVNITSVSGTTECQMRSIGYSLDAQQFLQQWSIYGAASGYNYSSQRCTANITALTTNNVTTPVAPGTRAPVLVNRPLVVARLNMRINQFLGAAAARRLPLSAALLERSLMLGVQRSVGERLALGAEVYFDREQLTADATTTALALLDWQATPALRLGLTLGSSGSNAYGSTQFLGLRFSARSRR